MTSYELRKYYGCDCVEVDEIDVDNMLGVSLPALGEHKVRCIDWQAVKAVYKETRSPDQRPEMLQQPYVELVFRDVKTAEIITTRIYSAGVAMFMRNLNDQLNGAAMGKKLSELLNLLKNKDVSLWVEWDKKYGQQVKFYKR